MTFKVPLKYADLTLGQLMTLQTEEDRFKRVAACADISLEELRAVPMAEVTQADEHLKRIAEEETGRHLKVIELNGQQYGFIPNWQEFSLGEWIDIEEYSGDFWNNAHKIMSILYRPILRRQGDAHTIEKYTSKEDSEAFKLLPADLFGGCILFFLSSRRTLLHTMKSCLLMAAESLTNSAINGDGILVSTPSQGKASTIWTRLQRRVWGLFSRISPISKTSIIS
mgnify:CR=1 FL=1|jgi:hypothetical protein|tara:strand:+ start:127 stop:801 length:675 start_codon:yes stop_codon:yes gene_type:complete